VCEHVRLRSQLNPPTMQAMFLVSVVVACMLVACTAVSPVIKAMGQGMQLLKPIFSLETKLQAAALGAIGSVDRDEVKEELAALSKTPCVIYTYALSPFSTEAIAALEKRRSYLFRELRKA
jgi:hypothetical protein